MSYEFLACGHSSCKKRILSLQRKAIRVTDALKYKDDCTKLKILTLPCIYIYRCKIYVEMNGKKFITSKNIHGLNTRHKDDITPNFNRLAWTQNSVGCKGMKLYKRLPPDLLIKKRLLAFLIEKCFLWYEKLF